MTTYRKYQTITLENDMNFIIMEHATYKEDNYYLVARLSNDSKTVLPEFTFLKEIKKDNNVYYELVDEPSILKILSNLLPKKD